MYLPFIFELYLTFGLLEVTCIFCTAGIHLLCFMIMMIIKLHHYFTHSSSDQYRDVIIVKVKQNSLAATFASIYSQL